MKLAYIYIENFKVLKNIGLSIDSQQNICFENEILKILPHQDSDKFYYEGLSISAIIGENGVGKTTILDFIEESFGYTNSSGFIVWFDNVIGYTVVRKNMIFEKVDNLSNYDISFNDNVASEFRKLKFEILKVDNIASSDSFLSHKRTRNKSSLVTDINLNPKNNRGAFFNLHDFITNSEWLKKFKGKNSNFEFYLPRYDKSDLNKALSLLKGSEYNIDDIRNLINGLVDENKGEYNVFNYYLDSVFVKSLTAEKYFFSKGNEKNLSYVMDVFMNYSSLRVHYNLDADVSLMQVINESVVDEKSRLGRLLKGMKIFADFFSYLISFYTKPVNFSGFSGITINVPDGKAVYSLVKHLSAISLYVKHSITYGWSGFSSGELALIKIFSGLQSKFISNNKESNRYLVIMDEVDLYLHPEWQREFLQELINFIKINFSLSEVQVLVTSHSPIIIGDFLPEDIISLKKDKDGDICVTESFGFGTQITDLYLDGMHLTSIFGALSKKHFDEILAANGDLTKQQEILISKVKNKNIKKMLGSKG
jgi:hypothetical protein